MASPEVDVASTWSDWLSLGGAIASIVALGFTILQARKAQGAAKTANIIRNQLVGRREAIEVAQIYEATRKIRDKVSAIGPGVDPSRLIGMTGADLAMEVQEYSANLIEHSVHYEVDDQNYAKQLCASLQDDITSLASADTPDALLAAGTNIYNGVSKFIPFAKSLSDDRRENVQTEGKPN